MGEVELAKTVLLPYLQRADELQKHDPLVAYYCRLYGMERGLSVPAKERSKTMNALLLSLMNQLEKDKKTVVLGPDDPLYVEGFALNVFNKADKQDRAGRADLNTAKTFYAASIFFEILNQFGEPQPEIEQKQKYAVWKAADIRKALSEGRTPQPGPPGGDAGFSLDVESDVTEEQIHMEHSSLPPPAPTPPVVDHYRNDSPPLPDLRVHQTTMQYSTSHYAPTAPDHPDPATRPESVSFQSTYPAHADNFHHPVTVEHFLPQNTGEDDRRRTNDYSHRPNDYFQQPTNDYGKRPFQSTYPSAPAGSAYYPTSTFPPASDHHTPSSYPSFGTHPSVPQQPAAPASHPSAPVYENPPATTASAPLPAAAKEEYDPNYKPSPGIISQSHKAARFAVSALAFDDVPSAISYLRRSLELLTSPSASAS